MLPKASRLRRRSDFTDTVRRGGRSGRPRLVVHLKIDAESQAAPCAGFVVARAVGPAVVRNRVRRRLRHLVAARLADLPAGSRLVVRALPASATSSFAELAADLDVALVRVFPAASRRRQPPASGDRHTGVVGTGIAP
jgi:ribonuclease P protein component